MTRRTWLIAGPTASGKSALALRLAEAEGAEIVNADSMQLYGDLNLLTARPSGEETARAPHHLFGTVDAADGWSVGRWLRAAVEVLEEIAARGRSAVVVGGTGLYFNALTTGLADIPEIPAGARSQAEADYQQMGEEAFRARLAEHDPDAAARIEAGDRQRLVRAWEVYAGTGRSLTDWRTTGQPALTPDTWQAVALDPPRDALSARGDARLSQMIDDGAIEEVRALMARHLDPALPIMKAVGVREFAAHLAGDLTLEQALTSARQQTRNYAKRQMTWMRGRMADWPRITEIEPDAQWGRLLALSAG